MSPGGIGFSAGFFVQYIGWRKLNSIPFQMSGKAFPELSGGCRIALL
jgi:hypothetical protein